MKRRIVIAVVVLVAIAAAVGWWWSHREVAPVGVLIASGTVEATEARVGFETGGRLERVGPREGDTVEAGAELATLDASQLQAHRQQAAARLAGAEAKLAEVEHGYRREQVAQAQSEVAAARTRLQDAERDAERTRVLEEGGAASREALDKAGTARDLARRRLDQTEQQAALLTRGPRPEERAAAQAVVAEAQAAVEAARAALADTTLTAPFAALVSVRHHQPGEVLPPGAPVLTLLDRDDRWVRIYVPEDRLGEVRLGAAATLRADTFPGRAYRGVVAYLSPEAEFTPKNVQTREERVRLVYAVKVRVVGDPAYELKPGMPVDVELAAAGGEGGRGDGE